MRVRAIDSNGDWDFGRGRESYKVDIYAVMQKVATHVRSWYYNCFFDLGAGIDWKNLLGKYGTDKQINLAVRNQILSIEEVVNLNDLLISVDENRKLTVSYEIKTIYGVFSDSVLIL